MNPKQVINSYIGSIRKEDNGHYLFYPIMYPKPHFMNSTVYEIWKLCNGQSIDDIALNLKNKYSKVPLSKLILDIKKVVKYLKGLGMLEYEVEVVEEMGI